MQRVDLHRAYSVDRLTSTVMRWGSNARIGGDPIDYLIVDLLLLHQVGLLAQDFLRR
jgi:hypothetical protein